MKKSKFARLQTVEAASGGIAGARTGAVTQQFDISRQVAKASAYLDRTQSEFAQKARNAKRLLGQAESGALAGPVLSRR